MTEPSFDVRLSPDSVAKLGALSKLSWTVVFWPWPCTALPWREERHRRLCWASDCQRWWGTANEPNEPPQVLRGCGQ